MADPSIDDDDFPNDEGEGGGGESTVSMTSPQFDPSMPMPISVPPPAMNAPAGLSPMQIPTAPVPFTPSGPVNPAAVPQGARPAAPGPSVPTPFGGLTPASQPKPLPAAGAAPPVMPVVPGMPPGMKRPQTVIGLAPPPVGAPRPGAPGGGARAVPLPSGRGAQPAAAGAPRPAAGAAAAAAPLSEKNPPSSGRGVKPPAIPASSPKPIAPASSSGKAATKDADSTDQQLAMPDNETPDSQKEDQPTMAKSLGESLALFGLDSGLTDAARAAVVPKPGGTPKPPVVAGQPPSNRSQVAAKPAGGPTPPPPIVAPPPLNLTEPLPILHDGVEEESTRAVSREEMMRGHDAVIMPEDHEDAAAGEDATLAVAPGMNEANSKHLAALAETLQKQEPPPPSNPQPFDPGFPPNLNQPQPGYPQQAYPQQPGYPQQGYDPNQQYAQSVTPQQPWGQQQQDPYSQQQQGWNQQAYPGSVGPVSGPHMPAQQPISQPHFPGAVPHQMPQSNPQLQVPQSGHMPQAQQMGLPGQPIPYPGQPMMHQPQSQPNPFGDWQGNQQNQGTLVGGKKPFKISGQILLLGVVGLVCLAIFITGIILFATTKF